MICWRRHTHVETKRVFFAFKVLLTFHALEWPHVKFCQLSEKLEMPIRNTEAGDSWKNMFCGRLSCRCAQLSFSQFRMLVRRRNSRHRKILVAPSRSTPTNPKEAELVNGCWRVSSQECSYHKPWFFCWDFFLHALSNSLIF